MRYLYPPLASVCYILPASTCPPHTCLLPQERTDIRDGGESDNSSAYTLIEDIDEVELSYKEEVIGQAEDIEIGED